MPWSISGHPSLIVVAAMPEDNMPTISVQALARHHTQRAINVSPAPEEKARTNFHVLVIESICHAMAQEMSTSTMMDIRETRT